MAHVNFDGLNLRITLDRMERNPTQRREFVVSRSRIANVAYHKDVWEAVQHRMTVMGIGYPGLVLIGTAETRNCRDFCLLSRSGPGLVIGLRGHHFDRILLSMDPREAWPIFVRLREVAGEQEPAAG